MGVEVARIGTRLVNREVDDIVVPIGYPLCKRSSQHQPREDQRDAVQQRPGRRRQPAPKRRLAVAAVFRDSRVRLFVGLRWLIRRD